MADVPGQIERLAAKLKEPEYADLQDKWKLLVLFIGMYLRQLHLVEGRFFPEATAPTLAMLLDVNFFQLPPLGANDICECRSETPDDFETKLTAVMTQLQATFPKTFVATMTIFNISGVRFPSICLQRIVNYPTEIFRSFSLRRC